MPWTMCKLHRGEMQVKGATFCQCTVPFCLTGDSFIPYLSLVRRPEAALVQCTPLTGRTHQIRLHLAHAGCPILGDDLYGPVTPLMPRQALHASRLTFWHPGQQRLLTFTAPLPTDMERALARLQLRPRSAA